MIVIFLYEIQLILLIVGVEIFYIGRPGQVVTIAGNFNNFNPFLNRLIEQEHNQGIYTIKLKDLPKGRIYYYFVDSGNKVIDKNNVIELICILLRELTIR